MAEADPNLLRYVHCDTGQYIWEIAKDLLPSLCSTTYADMLQTDPFWDNNHFLLPFMDEETCSQITYDTVSTSFTSLLVTDYWHGIKKSNFDG